MYNGSASILTNCSFSNNSAGSGGGMYNYFSSSGPTLIKCSFSANSASSSGGGMYNFSSSPSLTNCSFSANSASSGGGIYNGSSSSSLTNCSFTANSAKSDGGGFYNSFGSATLINCILWGNIALVGSQIQQSNGTTTATYSDIQGGFAGTGNIATDPLFVRNPSPGPDAKWGTSDDDYGDLHLQPGSPVADAGNNAAPRLAGITTDLGGGSRFLDIPTTPDTGIGTSPIVDMGAYEALPALSASTGGPYAVAQGRSLTLSAHGASTVAGSLQYAWEWTGDNKFNDATGPSPIFDTTGWPISTVTLSLRVTDQAGQSIVSTTTLRIVPAVLYVDQNVIGGGGNGADWANAFNDLQPALALALPGQEIHVADGTYKPTATTDRTVSFQLKDGVSLLGGYAGYGAANPDARDIVAHPTILSGDIGTIGDKSDNSYHVVVGSGTDATAILDGFAITAGNANGSNSPDNSGGGVYNYTGSPTLRNCSFSANSASSGGGIYNCPSSSPSLTNCSFTANSASSSGGGMYNSSCSPTLINCSFTGNSASSPFDGGGAMYNTSSSPTLSNCSFSNNSAPSSLHGGGIYNASSSSPTLTSCSFSNNAGGGMYNTSSSPTFSNCSFSHNSGSGIYNVSSSPSLTNCSFSDNSGSAGGGMFNEFSSPTLRNCSFTANSVSTSGGGMYNTRSSSPSLTNCSFTANSASTAGGGMRNESSSPTLTNCSFSNNSCSSSSGGGMYNGSSSPTLTNCSFSNNSASSSGGGIYSGSSSSSSITNCSFTGNSARFDGGGFYNSVSSAALTNCSFTANSASAGGGMYSDSSSSATLHNCILWGNIATSGSQLRLYGTPTIVTYCDVQGGWTGTANLNSDPRFIRSPSAGADAKWGTADDDYGDLRLQFSSPCIDAGSNSAVPSTVTTDLEGNNRFIDFRGGGAKVDMGAYERTLPASLSGTLFNDFDSDGTQDASEAGLSNWTVYLDANNNGSLDTGETSTTTSAAGSFAFTGLLPGTYTLRQILQYGYQCVSPTNGCYTVTLATDQYLNGQNFANHCTLIAPTANAGGPYSVGEGSSLPLSAAGSSDPDGTITSYEWDLNYDGQTFHPTATGDSPIFSAADLDGPATRTIALRVTDNDGLSAITTTTLAITNVAPTANFSNSGPISYGCPGAVTFADAFDPSSDDTAAGFTYSYDFDNDGTFEILDSPSPSAAVPASYLTSPGPHTIAGQIKDKDGDATAYTTSLPVNAPASIAGSLFADLNANGLRDGDETALSGWTVYLDANANGSLDAGETQTTTDAAGNYLFASLPVGSYTVRQVLQSGWKRIAPTSGAYSMSLSDAHDLTGQDFANHFMLAPTAKANGPYSLAEGSFIALSAAGSSDPDGTITSYEWDYNYDGKTFRTSASGATPTFSAASLNGPATRTLALRVTDSDGLSSLATTTLTLTNTAPNASFSAPPSLTQGQTASLTFSNASDPSAVDTAVGFSYSFDLNGDGAFEITGSSSASATVPASILSSPGSHSVTGRISDIDGGYRDYTRSILVTAPPDTAAPTAQLNLSSLSLIPGTGFTFHRHLHRRHRRPSLQLGQRQPAGQRPQWL